MSEHTKEPSACRHLDFKANVGVARLKDSGNFIAEITIRCRDCGLPFQFNGLQPGLDLHGAAVSADGLEARISISPKGARPNPVQVMGFGIKGFQ